jgi:hypothetical protein
MKKKHTQSEMIDARVCLPRENNNKTQTAQTHKAGERVAHELLDFWSGAARK